MAIVPPILSQTAGFPGQWSEDIGDNLEGLIVGETPPVVTVDLPLAPGQSLKAFTPVTFDDGELVEATEGTPAIGIILYDIETGTGEAPGVPVLRAGCLNKDIINWPDSYTTDAQKFSAFEGAPSPTNIVVRQAYYGSVVAQP